MSRTLLIMIGLVVLVGCGNGATDVGPPVISPQCDQAMAAAAADNHPAGNPLIIATLDACYSVTEWSAALDKYPGAMGLPPSADVGSIGVQVRSACTGFESSAMCRDAADRGLIDN